MILRVHCLKGSLCTSAFYVLVWVAGGGAVHLKSSRNASHLHFVLAFVRNDDEDEKLLLLLLLPALPGSLEFQGHIASPLPRQTLDSTLFGAAIMNFCPYAYFQGLTEYYSTGNKRDTPNRLMHRNYSWIFQ